MKNKVWIIIALVFVLIMISAVVLYPKLLEGIDPNAADTSPNVNAEKSSEGELDTGAELPQDTSAVVLTEDFTVLDVNMNRVKLSDYFGKPIVINFWASWCYPCKSELPDFNAMHQKYGEDVVFLMVNLTDGQRETVSDVKKFIADNGYTFPVYYDTESDAANAYGVYSIPETVFIKADGSLYDIRIGVVSEAVLEGYIKQLIGE